MEQTRVLLTELLNCSIHSYVQYPRLAPAHGFHVPSAVILVLVMRLARCSPDGVPVQAVGVLACVHVHVVLRGPLPVEDELLHWVAHHVFFLYSDMTGPTTLSRL